MDRISPFLWFENQAEEAANFYVSIFKNSKIKQVSPGPGGKAMVVSFDLDGRSFIALNGGPQFKFTEAISMVVNCETQEEIDYYWQKLTEGGKEVQCGWLKDKFGLSWQVVPTALGRLMTGDPERGKRVMAEVMKSVKFDIARLEQAANG